MSNARQTEILEGAYDGATRLRVGLGIEKAKVNKFGLNADIDTSTVPEDIWSTGGAYPFATFDSAQSLEIVSADANDAAAGTGARTVVVQGLDANGDPKEETVILNGTTAVDLTGQWTAVNRMYALTAGSGTTNAGVITVQVKGAGQVVSTIAAGAGQTEQCVFRVAAGHAMQIKHIMATMEGNAAATATFQLFLYSNGVGRALGTFFISEVTPLDRVYRQSGPIINAGEWVSIRATKVSANGTEASAEFDAVFESV